MARRFRNAAFLAFLLIALVIGGCGPNGDSGQDRGSGQNQDAAADGAGVPVLMLGRSVMYGWFQHWGWQGEGTVSRGGYELRYAEVAVPPDIAKSASGFIDDAPAGSIVFFKFCFDDFSGDEDADRELKDMQRWVRQVVEHARARDLKVVLGNALPKVKAASSGTLSDEHREFNKWLEGYADELGPSVRVYDFYSVLAGPDGALRPEYATSEVDSHANDTAYEELDPSFFALLEEFGR